jgi:hypothetical protein
MGFQPADFPVPCFPHPDCAQSQSYSGSQAGVEEDLSSEEAFLNSVPQRQDFVGGVEENANVRDLGKTTKLEKRSQTPYGRRSESSAPARRRHSAQ